MCGLFGFLNYGENEIKDISKFTKSLSEQSAIRGTDATGVAFNYKNGISIIKEAKSAYRFEIKHSDDVCALIGHTRHSTQGTEKLNYNNHPFFGKCGGRKFALAHNGILHNDKELRKTLELPETKIETDSYVAVQLIESQNRFGFDSIKHMSELTEGSFSYSILDDADNIWLVKGDSPICILHFPGLKMYAYASTEDILFKSVIDYAPLLNEVKKGGFEQIDINEGEILKICNDGNLERKNFAYRDYYGRHWWDFGISDSKASSLSATEKEYIEDLKSVAAFQGYDPSDIDELIEAGFSLWEIEDYIYYGMDGEM